MEFGRRRSKETKSARIALIQQAQVAVFQWCRARSLSTQ